MKPHSFPCPRRGLVSPTFPIHAATVLASAGLNPTEYANPPSVLYDRNGPVVTAVTLVHLATGVATVGIARLHPRDQFSRRVARQLALSRAVGPMVRFYRRWRLAPPVAGGLS